MQRNSAIEGVGPETPIETTATGGRQSAMPYRFDLLDPDSMFALAGILYYGTNVRGYAPDNPRYISVEDHLNHALMHIFAHLAGNKQDEHLKHAFTRVMFALEVELQGGPWIKSTAPEATIGGNA